LSEVDHEVEIIVINGIFRNIYLNKKKYININKLVETGIFNINCLVTSICTEINVRNATKGVSSISKPIVYM